MAMPQFTLRELMEAGVHFGHNTSRWNPKMGQYIYGKRNGIHIMDLQQTVPMLYTAMGVIRNAVSAGGRVLFVGTKRQAQDITVEAAERSGQYYINHRWLGGMLTNWKTISHSIKRLKVLEANFADTAKIEHLTKKERLQQEREFSKLQRALGGIKDMHGLPDVVVVFDAKKEHIAVAEANQLGIPVVGIVDSNVDPDGIDYPIPGNDDATRALKLYARLISDSVLDGISAQVTRKEIRSAGTTNNRKTVVKMSPKATAAAKPENKTVTTEPTKAVTATKVKEVKAEATTALSK